MSSITNLISVGVNGTGTANSVMKWLDADTATDSIITDNGSIITIGGGLTVTSDATINSLTVGRGAGNIAANTVLGSSAFTSNTTGTQNAALGGSALSRATTAQDNIAVGYFAGRGTTTGSYNIALGTLALGSATATTPRDNVAIGYFALSANEGNNNTAVGSSALQNNTTGAENVAVGKDALLDNTTGGSNTAVGLESLSNNTTATNNTSVGQRSLANNTTGLNNTALGGSAGRSLTTGSNNLLLGVNSGRSTSPSGEITTGSNNVVLGDNNITNLYCADTTISSSDARDKTDVEDFTYGLHWITQLRPVTYRWDKRAWYVGNDATTEDLLNAQPDGSKKRSKLHIGFLAQEELEVEKQFGFGETKDDMLIANINEDESAYGIKYERLVPVLVNAIKELKAEIELLKAK